MQKFVTIYLESYAYRNKEKAKKIFTEYVDRHGLVEEHLQEYLEDGWAIVSVSGFGGHSESLTARGWFGVVLEKK